MQRRWPLSRMGKTTPLMAGLGLSGKAFERKVRNTYKGAFVCDLRTPFAILAVKGFALVSSSMKNQEHGAPGSRPFFGR